MLKIIDQPKVTDHETLVMMENENNAQKEKKTKRLEKEKLCKLIDIKKRISHNDERKLIKV